jgi:methylenetetrahydrofolate dehydrogenase (NADP+)/methenyltetrahydrofolate cyclohydrolase
MKILDGKKLSAEISLQLKSEIEGFLTENKPVPKLVIFQVGDNEASNIYISRKIKFADQIGTNVELVKLPTEISQKDLNEKISEKSSDKNVHGIILQLPITKGLSSQDAFNCIEPQKDVDGLSYVNLSKLIQNDKTGIVPATARGIVTLLKENGIEIAGKKIAVIGRSVLVGKSTALNLLNNDATVTICHSKTDNLKETLTNADIIISAAGQSGLIKEEYIKEHHVIVDVSINVLDGKISGDVDSKLAENFSGYISPVPGGVGPMTVASLFMNLIDSYNRQVI